MPKTLTKEEFGLWLDEHIEPTLDDICGDNKSRLKWLTDLHNDLKVHAMDQDAAEADDDASGVDELDDELELETDGLEDE